MACPSPSTGLLKLVRSFAKLNTSDPLMPCLAPRLYRSIVTEASKSSESIPSENLGEILTETPTNLYEDSQSIESTSQSRDQPNNLNSKVLTTMYSWPSLEPIRFAWYNQKHLYLPMRRDILHRAVIYEADATRQGTASTKWRADVHGSGRKIRPQKGSGRARLGDKKSPMLKGGGVAFGPHPRDFSTALQRKVYDLAWRTALSYRYKKGELIILDNDIAIPRGTGARLLHNIFTTHSWGRGNGRALLVTDTKRERLFREMEQVGEHGLVKDVYDVDIKDMLEMGRIVIEKTALDALLCAHSSDLGRVESLERALTVAPKEEHAFLEFATARTRHKLSGL